MYIGFMILCILFHLFLFIFIILGIIILLCLYLIFKLLDLLLKCIINEDYLNNVNKLICKYIVFKLQGNKNKFGYKG